jgi:glutamine amidotransferase PdxT
MSFPHTRLVVALALLLAPAVSPPVLAQSVKKISVARFDDEGTSGKGPKMLDDKLNSCNDFCLTRLKAETIRAGKLRGYQALIVPGGSGPKQSDVLGEVGRTKIKEFVAEGGIYLGICAGCYLASSRYKGALDILPVTVVDADNWERGRAILTLRLTGEGKEWLGCSVDAVRTVYHNGPILQPMPDAKEKVIVLATFAEEITKKGARTGLMVHTPAIAAARYRKGWVIGVSPHPEQTAGLTEVVPALIRWAQAHPGGK